MDVVRTATHTADLLVRLSCRLHVLALTTDSQGNVTATSRYIQANSQEGQIFEFVLEVVIV